MPITRVKQFLDENNVRYTTVAHSPAFTAQEIAASAHVPGRELAKTVMVKLDGRMAMAVLPASLRVDLERLAAGAGVERAELAGEAEFRDLFGDCEIGAMPPFGNLYDLDVYVDESLSEDEEIAFNAGTHAELIRLAYAEFVRLTEPRLLAFAGHG
jgi:Ala-tRNA(Pro) deacylase